MKRLALLLLVGCAEPAKPEFVPEGTLSRVDVPPLHMACEPKHVTTYSEQRFSGALYFYYVRCVPPFSAYHLDDHTGSLIRDTTGGWPAWPHE